MEKLKSILEKVASGELTPTGGYDQLTDHYSFTTNSGRNGNDIPYRYQIDPCPQKKIRFCSNPGSFEGCYKCRVYHEGC